MTSLSHFNEKSGVIVSETTWGSWWQNVQEVHIEVTLPQGTRAKDLQISLRPSFVSCEMGDKLFFKGNLPRTIRPDESTWTIEDKKILRIVLTKADFSTTEKLWPSLIEDEYTLSAREMYEATQKLDLERFQMENPGMNFSQAHLAGSAQKRFD